MNGTIPHQSFKLLLRDGSEKTIQCPYQTPPPHQPQSHQGHAQRKRKPAKKQGNSGASSNLPHLKLSKHEPEHDNKHIKMSLMPRETFICNAGDFPAVQGVQGAPSSNLAGAILLTNNPSVPERNLRIAIWLENLVLPHELAPGLELGPNSAQPHGDRSWAGIASGRPTVSPKNQTRKQPFRRSNGQKKEMNKIAIDNSEKQDTLQTKSKVVIDTNCQKRFVHGQKRKTDGTKRDFDKNWRIRG